MTAIKIKMRTFAQKQNQPQKQVSSNIVQPDKATPGPTIQEHPLVHLQRTIGNRAVQRMLQAKAEELKAVSTRKASPRPGREASRTPVLQRACACGNHMMMGGECSECSKKNPSGLQTKLKVSEPGDLYEREADRVAEQIMATPAHAGISGTPPRIQRFSGQLNGQTEAVPASVSQTLASPGSPLDPALRRDMEQRFGRDFSGVRVHSGADAEQSARDVGAHAYTVGNDIVFGAGRFAPGRHEGRRLIAHELTHVVQQDEGQMMLQRESSEFKPCEAVPWDLMPFNVLPSIPGRYVDQGIALPYDKLAPLPDPTRGYDEEEVKRTFHTPSRLEQLYYDAATRQGSFQNRPRAIWLICNAVEAGARHVGESNAAALYQLHCLAGSLINRGCYTKWDEVLGDFSEGTASGRRVRGLILKGYADEAFKLNLDVQLIGYALQLMGGLSVAKEGLGRTVTPQIPKVETTPTIPKTESTPAIPKAEPTPVAPKTETTEHPKTAVPTEHPKPAVPAEQSKPTLHTEPPKPAVPAERPAPEPPKSAQPTEEPPVKTAPTDLDAVAKKSLRDKTREETQKKIKEVEQKKKGTEVKINSLHKAIRELNEKIAQLKERLKQATGSDKAQILKDIEEANKTLNENQGGGLRAELEGTNREQWELNKLEKNLNEALKLERPALRAATKRAIEAKAPRAIDGRFLDAKGQPINGPVHYGHIYGKEHRRLALEAQQKGMNQAQFNEWVNSHPEWFQMESEADNLSHMNEKPGID